MSSIKSRQTKEVRLELPFIGAVSGIVDVMDRDPKVWIIYL